MIGKSFKVLALTAFASVALTGTAFAQSPAAGSAAPAVSNPPVQWQACLSAPASTTPYSARINKEIADYGASKGIAFTVYSAEQKTEVQVEQLRDCIAKKPAGIILIANDVEALCPVLQEAKDAGIPVLTANAGVNCTDLVKGFTGPDYTLQAQILGQYTCDHFTKADGTPLNVAIVQGDLGYSAEIQRTGGFVDTIAAKCPDKVKIIDKQSGKWSQQQSLQVARDLVTKWGKDLGMIYAEDDTMAAGVAEGLAQSGLKPGDLILIGVGANVDGFKLMQDGWMQATVAQSPFVDGQLAVDTLLKIFAGETIPATQAINSPVVTPENMSQFQPSY